MSNIVATIVSNLNCLIPGSALSQYPLRQPHGLPRPRDAVLGTSCTPSVSNNTSVANTAELIPSRAARSVSDLSVPTGSEEYICVWLPRG